MFVYTVKGSNLKFAAAIVLSLIALIALIVFVPSYDSGALAASDEITYSNVKTNADRIAFLSQFGWTVEESPLVEEIVTIPSEFDRIFVAYNELQKEQGFDLSKFREKNVNHYRYKVTNCDETEGTVYCNLLIYRGNVIGGDICTADVNGFMRIIDSKNTKSS